MKCRVCDSSRTQFIYKLQRTPVFNNVHYPSVEKARRAPVGIVALRGCDTCGFVFNAAFSEKKARYTGVYNNTQSHSPYFLSYLRKLARYLFKKYDLRNKQVVEIGCGKGQFLEILHDLGADHIKGFDPAYESYNKNIDRLVIKKYFNTQTASGKADVIICRHTLEHIPRPREFAKTALACLAENGVIYIEVPDLSWTIKNHAFFDFTYEHCNYFTPRSLARLFDQFGFGRITFRQGLNGQYIQAEIRKGETRGKQPAPIRFSAVQHCITTYTKKWGHTIQQIGNFAIWGAGGKGVLFANRLRISRTRSPYIIDVNKNKQGKYIPGTAQCIVSPDMLQREPIDTIIIMNPVYQKEIRERAKKLGFRGKIITA